jgi:hypothetical protein
MARNLARSASREIALPTFVETAADAPDQPIEGGTEPPPIAALAVLATVRGDAGEIRTQASPEIRIHVDAIAEAARQLNDGPATVRVQDSPRQAEDGDDDEEDSFHDCESGEELSVQGSGRADPMDGEASETSAPQASGRPARPKVSRRAIPDDWRVPLPDAPPPPRAHKRVLAQLAQYFREVHSGARGDDTAQQLNHLVKKLESVESAARYLYHSNLANATGLLRALSLRQNQCVAEMLDASAHRAPGDASSETFGLLDRLCGYPSSEQADRMILLNRMDPIELVAQLGDIAASDDTRSAMAARLRDEILYSSRDLCHKRAAMTSKQWAATVGSNALNFGRDFTCQLIGRATVNFCANVLNEVAGVHKWAIFAAVGVGIPQVLSLKRLWAIESDAYRVHPDPILAFATVATMVVPFICPPLGAVAIMAQTAPILIPQARHAASQFGTAMGAGAEAFATGAISRALRELCMQLLPGAPSLRLTYANGTGLSAADQRQLNIVRQALYTTFSVLVVAVGGQLASAWLRSVLVGPMGKMLGQAVADALAGALLEGIATRRFRMSRGSTGAGCAMTSWCGPGRRRFPRKTWAKGSRRTSPAASSPARFRMRSVPPWPSQEPTARPRRSTSCRASSR